MFPSDRATSTAVALALGSGLLDSRGEASATFSIPAKPALAGLSMDWQALLGAPPALTNLEVMTYRDL